MHLRNVILLPLIVALVAACEDSSPPGPGSRPNPLSDEALAERRRIARQQLAPVASDTTSFATAPELTTALDIPAGMVASSSLTSLNPQATLVAPGFGIIMPRKGSSLAVLSTGNINASNPPEPGTDYPPGGVDGDSVIFRVTLNVPRGSNRLAFDFQFLSAESPEYVGTPYNDTFTARVIDGLGTRVIADASVNSSTFFDASVTRAGGTGFDTLLADDPWGVDYFPGDYPPEIPLFPDSGITNFRTVNVEVSSGGPVTLEFEISDLGDGILDSAVVIDNVTFSGMEVVDPNPSLIHGELGTVVTDTAQLSGSTVVPPVQKVAADGATQVLVRTKVPGPGRMTFSLVGGTSPTSGGLGAVGTSTRGTSVTVDAVLVGTTYYAFALYTSPPDFEIGGYATASSRPIAISGQYLPSTGTGFTTQAELTLVRPPLVIVHDIWSGCDSWQGASGIAKSPLFAVTCANYSHTSGASMDSVANRHVVRDAMTEALNEMRLQQTAVTQVDVIAHGMGGLLARKYVDSTEYRNHTNFHEGGINRLITMNTPHVGTRMADEIVKTREALRTMDGGTADGGPWFHVNALLNDPNVNTPIEVEGGAAIDDLRTDGGTINSIRETRVPAHVIVSQGAQLLPRLPTINNLKAKILYNNMETYHPLTYGKTTAERMKLILSPTGSKLFCGDAHDTFTAAVDQSGGVSLTGSAFSAFPVTDGGVNEHFSVPNSAVHRDRLIALLNSPVGGTSFVQALPSPSTLARLNSCAGGGGGALVGATSDEARVDPEEPFQGASLVSGSLAITSPAPGTQVTPGGTVTVTVAGAGGFQPETVIILGGGNSTILEAAPFSTQFQIPPQAIGSVELAAYGTDALGNILAAPRVVLPVASSARLTSIQVLNGDATLRGPGSTRRLVVNGSYSDGVTRDISSPARGTLYSTSNTSIATITNDGALTGISPGSATITVRNGTVFTSITVTVGTESAAQCIQVRLGEFNLFVLEDYLHGNEVQGKVAAGRDISLENFSVGKLLAENDSSNVLVAGGNLSLSTGTVWGDARYGGDVINTDVTYARGTLARGTPINFAARANSLRTLSSGLAGLPANGTTTLDPSWGGIMLMGTNPKVNVFDLDASAFSGATLLTIEAPADSLVLINVRGTSASFINFGHLFSGGIDERGVLFNLPDATSISAQYYGFYGTVLAPNANVTFNDGAWVGGMYVRSLKGNAVGHIRRLRDTDICK